MQRRILAAVGVGFLASLVIVLVTLQSQPSDLAAQDTDYLENFTLGPSTTEELEREREAGVEGPIHVPPDEFPSPDGSPKAYGPYYLVPQGWIGPEDYEEERLPRQWDGSNAPPVTEENIRESDLWRTDLKLPDGFAWTLDSLRSEGIGLDVAASYSAPRPDPDDGHVTLEVHWGYRQSIPIRVTTWPRATFETTTIDGHPAIIRHPLPGGAASSTVRFFDESTGVEYTGTVSGLSVQELAEVVRSLAK